MMEEQEREILRRTAARNKVAQRLSPALTFALGAGLDTEAALIAKLIEAILTNMANDLIIKLYRQQ